MRVDNQICFFELLRKCIQIASGVLGIVAFRFFKDFSRFIKDDTLSSDNIGKTCWVEGEIMDYNSYTVLSK